SATHSTSVYFQPRLPAADGVLQCLLEIIRDLIRNPNPENKKHLENRIEEQFSHSSHNLDKLLNKSSDDIFAIINLFARPRATSRGGAVRGDLARCCQLLQLKRDELRSLYTGHVELHKSVKLLTRIRHVGSAPARIQACLAIDDYLGAARELTDSQRILDKKLHGVKSSASGQISIGRKPGSPAVRSGPQRCLGRLRCLASKDLSQVPAPEHGESVNSILCLLEAACCLDKLPQNCAERGLRHTVLAKRLNLLVLRSPALAQSPSVAAYSEENPALAAIVSQLLRDLLGDYLDVRGENLSYESAGAAGPAPVRPQPAAWQAQNPRQGRLPCCSGLPTARTPSAPPVRLQPPQRPPLLPAPISPTAPAPRSKKTAASPGKQRRPLALVCPAAQSNIVEAHELLRGCSPPELIRLTLRAFVRLASRTSLQALFLVTERSRNDAVHAAPGPTETGAARARAPLLQSCAACTSVPVLILADTREPMARHARRCLAHPGTTCLQQFGRCLGQSALSASDQTAVHRRLPRTSCSLLSDPAASGHG
uniref:Exocyst complex component Sec8 n=1 Tax=Macrostomum lignano TaxID=282301 RepID=A0A1I8FC52_9PLAT